MLLWHSAVGGHWCWARHLGDVRAGHVTLVQPVQTGWTTRRRRDCRSSHRAIFHRAELCRHKFGHCIKTLIFSLLRVSHLNQRLLNRLFRCFKKLKRSRYCLFLQKKSLSVNLNGELKFTSINYMIFYIRNNLSCCVLAMSVISPCKLHANNITKVHPSPKYNTRGYYRYR